MLIICFYDNILNSKIVICRYDDNIEVGYQMENKLKNIENKNYNNSLKKNMVISFTLFLLGAILGIVSKILDIYTTNVGNIFSELSIWILFGVIISVYSKKSSQASCSVFSFCIGMLITYYATAELTNSVYSMNFIYGWVIFSLCSPLFAYITWYSKKKNILSLIISIGIILVTILSSIIIFDGLRIYDYIIILILFYYLFIKNY